MPRITYADRFLALLARPLSKRDRQFCESLQHFYKSKGRLTSGRARCVRELEDRYSAEKLAEAAERGLRRGGRPPAPCRRASCTWPPPFELTTFGGRRFA